MLRFAMATVLMLSAPASVQDGSDQVTICGRLHSTDQTMAGFTLPALTGRVVDEADLLQPEAEQEMTARLGVLEAATTDQLVVVTLPSLGGHEIAAVGLALGNGWGIGQERKNNGVLLIVAPSERKVRI